MVAIVEIHKAKKEYRNYLVRVVAKSLKDSMGTLIKEVKVEDGKIKIIYRNNAVKTMKLNTRNLEKIIRILEVKKGKPICNYLREKLDYISTHVSYTPFIILITSLFSMTYYTLVEYMKVISP